MMMEENERHNVELMSHRIRRILLVCNNYDSYTLEEDGHIEAQIAEDYAALNLSNPPEIVRVETTFEALEKVRGGERFDLVITMYNMGEVSVFDFASQFKSIAPDTPIVLLASFSREIYRRIQDHDTSAIDWFFCWNNSTDLIIAIIKLLEDRMNAEHDILEEGVRAILLIEDSVRYYSSYLPTLYRLVLRQNSDAISDTLNEKQQTMRKRSRPKILMASCYDDAVELYERYKQNILGVISDIGFVVHRDDAPEKEKLDAGIDLCHHIRKDNPTMPILMQSSQESMREVARELGVGFVLKTSKTLTHDLSEYIGREFGFGDFVVTDPNTGEELLRAKDLYGFEKIIKEISDSDFRRLSDKNYISRWLFARGLFSLGKQLRPLTIRDDSDLPEIRRLNLSLIHDFRIMQGVGVVAKFNPATYNDTIRFSRLGSGSLGGKGRGLAFLNHVLVKYDMYDKYEDVRITVPRTLVITTEYFDRFIIDNGLQYVINSDISDSEILSEFVASTLPQDLTDALKVFIHKVRKPLAVRSSSKLEDSYYQPFAGVYSTYMIPRTENEDQQLRLLSKAIKSVYASIFYASSRSYITATANMISEEKMAIILQEICGSSDQGYFFPTLSGVARSVNFYPIGHEKAEEGIVKVAFGLGKAVVDGDLVLRFSPKYPKHVLQTSTIEQVMTETQKQMFALNLNPEKFKTSIDDAVNLEHLDISDCEKFRNLKYVVSTWDLENQRMVDSAYPTGPRYVTFAQMLKYKTFPLAEIVQDLLDIAAREMKCGVEIEFAADLDRGGDPDKLPKFQVLQIRPISVDSRNVDVDWDEIDTGGAMLKSESALGTGWIKGVHDVIYLKKDAFDTQKTTAMGRELTAINTRMRTEGKNYVLIGFGRWGSSIPSLGVPVQWSNISEAKVIVECSLEDFRVDPSQGTHFFQNLTSFNAGYINVDPYGNKDDVMDFTELDKLPAVEETEFIRHVRFDRELEICIDGRNSKAFIK
ncbi:MAG: phosphoenolpyruvate synthase [Bacteroidaceae bacterium]|nr:phosphoenolpyruvate synthase [Bacteroidaceae bacterium]